jgi:hypothetical protein
MSEQLSPAELQAEADQFRNEFEAIREAVGKVIVGQQRVVEATLTALLWRQRVAGRRARTWKDRAGESSFSGSETGL